MLLLLKFECVVWADFDEFTVHGNWMDFETHYTESLA